MPSWTKTIILALVSASVVALTGWVLGPPEGPYWLHAGLFFFFGWIALRLTVSAKKLGESYA